MYETHKCPKCGKLAQRNHNKGYTGGSANYNSRTGKLEYSSGTDRHYECECGHKFVEWHNTYHNKPDERYIEDEK